ncbi:Annexin [Ramaria rubella]|nr:Annexin [Ramaria rubella]
MNPNQYPPPGQYGGYGSPPPQPQQWGQPPQGGYGAYPPPGAPPPQQSAYSPYGGGYAPPPPSQPGGYAPPPGPPAQLGGYAVSYLPPPGGAPQPGGYVPPPQPPSQSTAPMAPYPPPGGPPAAPHHAYGIPPQQQQQYHGGYPAPPVQQGPLMYLGVPIPPPPPAPALTGALPGFDAQRVAETLRKAMKGFGTDEKALTGALAPLDAFQMDAVRRTFETSTGKGLLRSIEKETSSWYENCLRAKVLGPVLFDCWLIHRACSGAGTHEDILTEILLDRTNSEMQTLKDAYRATYGRDMISVVRGELSAKTERLFNMALVGSREESEYVDPARVQADVKTLYDAGRGRMGTDEITICSIIVSRSPAHLRALAQAYPQAHKRKLSKAIDHEFSGHMDAALRFVASGTEGDGYGVHRDVDMIEESMHGMGTKDERLIYRVIRAHWNRARFQVIKQAFHQKHGKTLLARVRGETGGDYRDFMSAIIGN